MDFPVFMFWTINIAKKLIITEIGNSICVRLDDYLVELVPHCYGIELGLISFLESNIFVLGAVDPFRGTDAWCF